MKMFGVWLAFALFNLSAIANELTPAERQNILDATRPRAAKLAGQAVRIKVDKLNLDQDWAVLVGGLVSATGKPMDWSLAEGCEPDLDKMLFVVLKKTADKWQVKHMEICAAEPPYWSLEQYGGMIWPCGVYAGLDNPDGHPLEASCKKQRPQRTHKG